MKHCIMEYFQIFNLLIQRTLHSEVIHVQKCWLVIHFWPTIHPLNVLNWFGLIEIINFELLSLKDFIVSRRIWWLNIDPIIYVNYATDYLDPDFCLFSIPGVKVRSFVDFDNWKFHRILQVQFRGISFFEITLDYICEGLTRYFYVRVVTDPMREYLSRKVYVNVAFEILISFEETCRLAFWLFVKAAHH